MTIPDEPTWDMLIALMRRSGGSEARSTTGIWALEQLRSALGDTWPELWYAEQGRLPSLLLDASFHAAAYARLVRFALQFASLHGTPGLGRVTKELRGHRELHRLIHAQLQLESASLLGALGLKPTLESMRHDVRRPADLLLSAPSGELIVECFAVHQDAVTKADFAYDEKMSRHITAITLRHGVFLAGRLGSRLSDEETVSLITQLTSAARDVSGDGVVRTVQYGDAEVRVLPMQNAAGQTLEGPTSRMRGWPRDRNIICDKAKEWTESAAPVWLRVDLHDGMWMFSDWARVPLARKTSWMAALMRQSLEGLPLAGVVVSSGAAMVQGTAIGESCRCDDGSYGLRRQIATFLARELIVVPLSADAANMRQAWVRAYDREPEWLEDALRRAGLPPISALELS